MEKQQSLTTVALLSVLWEKEKRDYLDVLSQFVLQCIPSDVGRKIDIGETANLLRKEYGFADIPSHVVQKVFSRLCKTSNNPRYVRKENHEFYVQTAYVNQQFRQDRTEVNRQIAEVLDSLSAYFEKHYVHKKLAQDDAADKLFSFFETYGLTVVSDYTKLRGITAASGADNFYVAQFILNQIEQRTLIHESLISITKGFLIHKAVYFYSTEFKGSIDSKLRGVRFFLDCSLILDALGYDSDSDQQAFEEMVHLIRSNGGSVCCFEHTILETANLLQVYAQNPQRRNKFSFPNLEKRAYPQDILLAMAQPDAIGAYIRKNNIEIVERPTIKVSATNKGSSTIPDTQNPDIISKQLSQYPHKKRSENSTPRTDYDAFSLAAIGHLRKNECPTRIETCGAVFVTQDWRLCQCMYDMFPQRFPPEISYAIKDLDLVSVLWLGQYSTESQLPKHLLIANAVAACKLNSDIMDKAIALAGKLVDEKVISEKAALIMRSQPVMRDILLDLTKNNMAQMTDETVKAAIQIYVSQESAAEQQAAVAQAVASVKQQFEIELAASKKEQQLETRSYEEKERKQKNNMRKSAEQRARKSAACAYGITKKAFIALFVLFFALSALSWYHWGINVTNWLAIIFSIVTLLQILDYCLKIVGCAEKVAVKVSDSVFTKRFDKELSKVEQLTGISLRI